MKNDRFEKLMKAHSIYGFDTTDFQQKLIESAVKDCFNIVNDFKNKNKSALLKINGIKFKVLDIDPYLFKSIGSIGIGILCEGGIASILSMNVDELKSLELITTGKSIRFI